LDRHDYTGFRVLGLVGEDLQSRLSGFYEPQHAVVVALA
jgi:hypothetical protein